MTVQFTAPCQDSFPPQYFTVVLITPFFNTTQSFPPDMAARDDGIMSFDVVDLMEDTRYLFYVMAINEFGDGDMSPTEEICKLGRRGRRSEEGKGRREGERGGRR